MSNVTNISIDSRREEQAGLWIAKIDRGLSESEKTELAKWLNESPDNYREFVDTAEFWDEMDAISMLAEVCEKPAPGRSTSTAINWSIAASALVASALLFVLLNAANEPQVAESTSIAGNAGTVLSTDVGEQSTFDLPDGSSLTLNTNSSVIVSFSAANRIIRLERGELHIQVAHEARPLSVQVGEQIIQALGTEFNVEITSDQTIELVVTDGLVVVGMIDAPVDSLPGDQPIELAATSTLVASGEEAIISQAEETLHEIETEQLETEDIEVKLSWRNGNIIFTGQTLEEAVQEVERYTAVKFVFLDEDSKMEPVAGFFKAGDVEGLLRVLRAEFQIAYQWVGDSKVELALASGSEPAQ